MKNLPSSSPFLWTAVLSIGVLITGVSHAIPTQKTSGSSGSSEYRVYTLDGISWTEARTYALGLGAGWDLVSITSAAEQAFVETLFTFPVVNRDHFWIGLNDATAEGTYEWSNGDAFSYSNWHSAEPSNGPGEEDYVALDYRDGSDNLGSGWKWNDIPNDSYPTLQKGFVVERVPDGGITLILLGLGLTGLAIGRRFLKA